MTVQLLNKPFYLKPPLSILFDTQKLDKIRPWEIDIAFLLASFLEEMEVRKEVDFRASGVALVSSASIYQMKTDLLLKLEEPPLPSQAEVKPDFLPPPLILPLRYELTTTTIQDLLEALDNVLKGEKIFTLKPQLEPVIMPQVLPVLSAYLMELEKELDDLYKKILLLVEKSELVTFSKLASGLDKLEKVKTFIILLFMAQRKKVTLWQEEDYGEIYVSPLGGQ